MEYTKYYGHKFCEKFGKEVAVLEYSIDYSSKVPYCDCDRCNKPIKRKMIVLQDVDTDAELVCLGMDCAKKLVNI